MLKNSIVRLLGIILLLQATCGLPTDQQRTTVANNPSAASETEAQHEAMSDISQSIHTQADTFNQLFIKDSRAICVTMVRELKALPHQSDALQAIVMRFVDCIKRTYDFENHDLDYADRLAETFNEIWLDSWRMAKKSNLLEAFSRAVQNSRSAVYVKHIKASLLEFAKRFNEHLEKVFNAMTPAEREKYANIIALYEQYKAKEPSIKAFRNFIQNLKAEYDKIVYV